MNNIQAMIQKAAKGWDFLKIYTAVKQSKNPQQLVINTMKKYGGNNPMVSNLVSLAENGDAEGIEQFARKICHEYGADFDTEFKKFKQTLN